MLTYLRIVVTALSLTACVLLVALWVRSYYRLDTVSAWPGHTLSSLRGGLFVDAQFSVATSQETVRVVRPFAGTSFPLGNGSEALTASASRTPTWFIALMTAIAAAFPWIGWRFSLRTLLIATTLVAVVLGIVVLAR